MWECFASSWYPAITRHVWLQLCQLSLLRRSWTIFNVVLTYSDSSREAKESCSGSGPFFSLGDFPLFWVIDLCLIFSELHPSHVLFVLKFCSSWCFVTQSFLGLFYNFFLRSACFDDCSAFYSNILRTSCLYKTCVVVRRQLQSNSRNSVKF